MSKVYVNRRIVKRDTDKIILRDYNSLYSTFNYYLFSVEGDIVMQITDCNCRQIPKVMLDKYEDFSVEKEHEKERAEFKEWIKKEGYKE